MTIFLFGMKAGPDFCYFVPSCFPSPVLEGMDSNGKGVIDGYVEDYELSDIYQTNFKFGAYKSI